MKKIKVYVDLLFSAHKQNTGFLNRVIPDKYFIEYLSIKNKIGSINKKIKHQYYGITKARFKQEISLTEKEKKLIEKKIGLENILGRVECTSVEDIYYKKIKTDSNDIAFGYFCHKTGQVKDKKFKFYKLSESNTLKVEKYIELIGIDILELKQLREIYDHLQFFESYSKNAHKIKVREKAAGVCWELFKENNNITKVEILERIENEYRIRNYDDCTADEGRKKIKKAVTEWIRYMKNNKNIIIQD